MTLGFFSPIALRPKFLVAKSCSWSPMPLRHLGSWDGSDYFGYNADWNPSRHGLVKCDCLMMGRFLLFMSTDLRPDWRFWQKLMCKIDLRCFLVGEIGIFRCTSVQCSSHGYPFLYTRWNVRSLISTTSVLEVGVKSGTEGGFMVEESAQQLMLYLTIHTQHLVVRKSMLRASVI